MPTPTLNYRNALRKRKRRHPLLKRPGDDDYGWEWGNQSGGDNHYDDFGAQAPGSGTETRPSTIGTATGGGGGFPTYTAPSGGSSGGGSTPAPRPPTFPPLV